MGDIENPYLQNQGERHRRIPGTYCPASLDVLVSSKFSEIPCLEVESN